MRPPGSLRSQLVLWTMLAMLAVLAASAIATYLIALGAVDRAFDYTLQDQARTIAERIDVGGNVPRLNLPVAAREVLVYDSFDRVYFDVRSRRHGVLAGSGTLPMPDAAPPAEGLYYSGIADRKPVRLFALPVGDDLQVVVAETLNKRRTLTAQILGTLFVADALLVALGGALLWYGTGRALAPLRRVVDALALRGRHDLSPVHSGSAPTELRYLAQAINDLMARLEQSISTQQRFIADAAHQLRTPLAGLLAQIADAMDEREPQRVRAAIERLRLSSKRTARLVNQLLTAARAEPGQQTAQNFELVDLVALARDTCARWVPEALENGKDLGFGGVTAPIPIAGNAPMLEDMLGNLIENAIRYGKPGGTINVDVSTTPEAVTLQVSDDGAPIAAAERERLFDRFYRRPGSPGSGSGLGLAIARDIARMHGADIDLASDQAGNRFFVRFGKPRTSARMQSQDVNVTTPRGERSITASRTSRS